jgi:hypothetical protein
MPGDVSQEALVALADASEFLDLPASEILPKAVPDQITQGPIVSRAVKFVGETIARMPNLFGTRTSRRFQDVRVDRVKQNSVPFLKRSFVLVDKSSVAVN